MGVDITLSELQHMNMHFGTRIGNIKKVGDFDSTFILTMVPNHSRLKIIRYNFGDVCKEKNRSVIKDVKITFNRLFSLSEKVSLTVSVIFLAPFLNIKK